MVAAAASATGATTAALLKRYAFWQAKLNKAIEEGNEEGTETASNQIAKLEAEAAAAGVDLTSAPESEAGPVAVPTKSTSKSVQGKEKVAARAAGLAAAKAAKVPGTGKTTGGATPRVKKEKVLQPCLDGCGEQVPGNFKMGHDAKLKSMILKIERGEMDMQELPEIAQELVGFKKGEKEVIKDKAGKTTSTVQNMICVKAPVRFQGRPEITLTTRG